VLNKQKAKLKNILLYEVEPRNMSDYDPELNEVEEEETNKVDSLCADLSCLCVCLCVGPKEAKPKEQFDQIISSIIGE
jgi:hypothetical protein